MQIRSYASIGVYSSAKTESKNKGLQRPTMFEKDLMHENTYLLQKGNMSWKKLLKRKMYEKDLVCVNSYLLQM